MSAWHVIAMSLGCKTILVYLVCLCMCYAGMTLHNRIQNTWNQGIHENSEEGTTIFAKWYFASLQG